MNGIDVNRHSWSRGLHLVAHFAPAGDGVADGLGKAGRRRGETL